MPKWSNPFTKTWNCGCLMLGKKFQTYHPKRWWKMVMNPIVQSMGLKSPKKNKSKWIGVTNRHGWQYLQPWRARTWLTTGWSCMGGVIYPWIRGITCHLSSIEHRQVVDLLQVQSEGCHWTLFSTLQLAPVIIIKKEIHPQILTWIPKIAIFERGIHFENHHFWILLVST